MMEKVTLKVTGRNQFLQGNQDVTDILLSVVVEETNNLAPSSPDAPPEPTRTISGTLSVRYVGKHADLAKYEYGSEHAFADVTDKPKAAKTSKDPEK